MSDERNKHAFEGMLDYGRRAIQAIFLLNGGAVLTLFAFIGAIVKDGKPPVPAASFVPGISFFILGLIFVVIAWAMGYWNFRSAYDSGDASNLNKTLAMTASAAVISCFLSMLCFIVGASLTACTLTRF